MLARVALGDFAKDVGEVQVGPVAPTNAMNPLRVPYITWGGDIATFYANGGLTTAPGTIFAAQGLNLELTGGDDFAQQVRDYISGKSPFLRGTFSMIGMASEMIGRDPRTKGVVFLQLTWSLGDHMVGRKEFKSLNDLKGKTICLQQGGPHVGFLDDLLDMAKLSWDDVKVVWAKDLTASKDHPDDNPAAMFRKNPQIDACFVISPDMASLCGDLESVGNSAKVPGQVDGAHVVVSTHYMNHAIADVYVCRQDFFDANKALMLKFTTGFLKGCEEVSALQRASESTTGSQQDKSKYQKLQEMSQNILGKEAVPTLDDVDGLLTDCEFAGYRGNVKFFTWGPGNTVGYEAKQKRALDLAVSQQYASRRIPLAKADFDYRAKEFTGYLSDTKIEEQAGSFEARKDEIEKLVRTGGIDEKTLLSFNIFFEANQGDFREDRYRDDFDRAVRIAAQYANAGFVIRGHCDPYRLYQVCVEAGKKKGMFKRVRDGATGELSYLYNDQPFDLKKMGVDKLMQFVQSGVFEGAGGTSPKAILESAQSLSEERAAAVKQAIVKYAEKHQLRFEAGMLTTQGMGMRQPVVLMNTFDYDQEQKNRRVEFRVIRVSAETSVGTGSK
jgi:outer membrane protein OmpA-like peptidoglycan-associated protein